MSQIPTVLREQVRNRARNHCEYCLIPEIFIVAHEPDHVIAIQHRGPTSLDNLALACFDCNRRKGPNLSSVDPNTGQVVSLFNPRRDTWSEHFYLEGARIVGRTPVGRATTELLQFNSPQRVHIREALQKAGRY